MISPNGEYDKTNRSSRQFAVGPLASGGKRRKTPPIKITGIR